jgi:hypothetical protein
MRRVHNGAVYEELEAAVAKALVSEIRAVLQQVGLRGEELKSTVDSVASSVAAIYDGAAYVEGGEDYVVPILGFAVGRSRNQLLVPEEGGSGVHEFIPGAIEEAFGEPGA